MYTHTIHIYVLHIYIHIYIRKHTCIYMCVYMYMYICVCVCVYMERAKTLEVQDRFDTLIHNKVPL